MSGVKTCPLCGSQRWQSDNKLVVEQEDMEEFRLWGLKFADIKKALDFAKTHGWQE